MADPYSLIVIEEALSRFASPLDRRTGQLENLKKVLEKLKDSLKLIEPVLKNADQMQSDEATRDWLQRLQDAADDLRDLLDEDAYGVHRQKGQFKKQVYSFLFPSKSMLSKIKEINVSFDRILEESNCIRLINHNQNREAPRREADESFYNFEVLQRDDDVSKIESLLDELSQEHPLSGLSMVGMPGVGKTTVARSICVRAREKHSSNLVALVPVHKDFNEEMILGQMLESLDSHAGGMTNIGPILYHLKPKLQSKKILLILDGVWNEEDAQWLKEFISCLPQRFRTARISVVITTSNKEVASLMMDPIPWRKYELQKLSDEDCWLIMEENVLRSSNRISIEDPQLVLTGKDIAKQCGGLPLVAAVFGEHLGTRIGVNECKSDKEEDVGNKYFNDLVSNYLLEDMDMDECGNIKFCKMHDEVHNLALLSAKYETYIWPDTYPVEESVRHMRVQSDQNLQAVPEGVAQRLHSLFLDVNVLHMPRKFRSLQSLKLAAADANDLESALGRLKYYMKYLDISGSAIEGLPKSVTKLYNLQTLRFRDCNSLETLPSGIENLVGLRHIYFDDERHVPSSIGKLTSLQTLPLFVVGTEKGRRIEELENLKELRRKLKICKLELVSQSEASKAKLKDKGKLIKLQFVWSKNRANSDEDMGVLEGLQPPSTLKSLTIENYRGGSCPSWMMNLEQLVKLKLIDCDECGDISCLELLPELKVLNLEAMPNVRRIGKMSYHQSSSMASSSQGRGDSIAPFPVLRKLTLRRMTKLEKWTEAQGMVMFPCLEELDIQNCPELKTWWASSSQGRGDSITPFPVLRKLTLSNMTKLEKWTEARGMVVFPCLEEFDIQHCPELKTWWASNSQGKGDSITPFPVLRKLALRFMTKLEKWTEAQGMVVFPCLEELDIRYCPELKTWWASNSQSRGDSITPFPVLRKLTLGFITNLEKWTEAQGMVVFPCLEELNVWDCPQLKTWWASNSQGRGDSITPFPVLRKLELTSMRNLEKLTEAQGMIVFPCLQELHIENCFKLETWWASSSKGRGDSITLFPVLRKLELTSMRNLEKLTEAQGMVMFASLEELDIQHCFKLKTWWASSSQGRGDSITPFPVLRKLTLKSMKNLEKWTEAQGMIVFPCLEELDIQDCPELKTWWASRSEDRGDSITPFPVLRKLTLSSMTKLEKWTEAQGMVLFPCLEELDIQNCPKLKTWWASCSQGRGDSITPFPVLRKLSLSSMTKLEKWPEAQGMVVFPCLEELDIQNCPKLKTWWASSSQSKAESILPFPALRKLNLSNMTRLEKWTEAQGMVVFPCLEELHIWYCPKLKTWWEDGSACPNLSILGIQSCPELQAIPIGLSNLTSLDINNCPKLMGYAQEGSYKWSSICHAHRIRINGQIVRSQRS
ncbi:hypothetical protein SLEP1_g41827 [Rubroshorea leprosula]|uniref:Uncharacterized protein n=1 Tax=Rubroshorea leprosula TaxID=152421 RepID=A0AAV5L840_9ROSI|nr:hypothetical protein SLEP1_g41827 [Rubroshorea leprosula]